MSLREETITFPMISCQVCLSFLWLWAWNGCRLSLILHSGLARVSTCAFIWAFPKGHKNKAQNPKTGQSCPFFLGLRCSNALCEFSALANSSISLLIPHKPRMASWMISSAAQVTQAYIFPEAKHHYPDDSGKIKSCMKSLLKRPEKKKFQGWSKQDATQWVPRTPTAAHRMASSSVNEARLQPLTHSCGLWHQALPSPPCPFDTISGVDILANI